MTRYSVTRLSTAKATRGNAESLRPASHLIQHTADGLILPHLEGAKPRRTRQASRILPKRSSRTLTCTGGSYYQTRFSRREAGALWQSMLIDHPKSLCSLVEFKRPSTAANMARCNFSFEHRKHGTRSGHRTSCQVCVVASRRWFRHCMIFCFTWTRQWAARCHPTRSSIRCRSGVSWEGCRHVHSRLKRAAGPKIVTFQNWGRGGEVCAPAVAARVRSRRRDTRARNQLRKSKNRSWSSQRPTPG
jgi:hypothetical protein